MKFGYARVSTTNQSTDAQIQTLKEYGCDKIFSDTSTRRNLDRDGLNNLLKTIKKGDMLVVTKLDRLAGNTREALSLIEKLFNEGIEINILNLGVINNSTTGKLIFTVFSAFAEFEVDLIKERMLEGKEIARKNPSYKEGRPNKYSPEKIEHALSLLKTHTYKEVERMTGISKSTLIRKKSLSKGSST